MRFLVLLCCLVLGANAYAADAGYHIIKRLQVGGEGGWDYLTVDAAARRLYVSRSSHVLVIDLDTDKVIGDIPNTPGIHGIAIVSELNRGFTSNGRSNTATVFDLRTLKVIGEVRTGGNPDAILYEPVSRLVFTFNGRSHDATVFDAASGKVVGTIPLGGKPEFATVDGKGMVFVNVEDTNEVVGIDAVRARVVRRYSIKPCDEPTGMGLDAEHGRVFSGCHNKIMAILDVQTGKLLAAVPIGGNVDGNGFDPATGLAFSSNGDGTLTVVRESAPGSFEVAATVPTQRGSRTMAIDPKTNYIYLPAAQFRQPPLGGKTRPEMEKGSFEILVVGR